MLSLPLKPVVFPIYTEPALTPPVKVFEDLITQFLKLQLLASFKNETTETDAVEKLTKFKARVVPVPPGLPSMVTYFAPLNLNISDKPLLFCINTLVAVASGLMVNVLVGDMPG